MKNILSRLRERENYHEVSATEAEGMGFDDSSAYHEKLSGMYRRSADELEAALKIEEGANLQPTTATEPPLPFDKCMVEGRNNEAVMLGSNGRFCLKHG
jgi:hypothetical protein